MRRRKVNVNAVEYTPDVQLESHLSTFASVRSAVEAACLDEGTTFTSMGNFDYNAFYMPLMNVAGQMQALMWAVDRWAFRAKYMKHINCQLTHVYNNETLTDDERFAEISDQLSRCKPYDTSYCRVFRGVIAHLDLLSDAGATLINFISLICAEGNFLAFDSPEYLGIWDYQIASSDETFSTASSSNSEPHFSSSPNIGYSSVRSTHLTTPPHHATPTWKLSLAHKYATERLFVGANELEVFAKTLGYARVARMEIKNARRSISGIAALAERMQEVFDKWANRCEMWEMDCAEESEGMMIWEDQTIGETEQDLK